MTNKNIRQKKYLREWESSTDVDYSEDRDIQYVNSEIDRMKKSLGLDDATGNQAFQIYKAAKDKNLIRGRSIDKILCASMYIAIRQLGKSRSVDELADVSVVNKNEIVKIYRYLSNELGLPIEIVNPETYLDRYMKKVNSIRHNDNVEIFDDKVKQRAKDIIEVARGAKLESGKSPTGFAAASLYLAGKQLGYKKVRQSDLANIGEVSELTIRKRYQEMEEVWEKTSE